MSDLQIHRAPPGAVELFTLTGVTVNRATVDAACEQLYLGYQANPTIFFLSREDVKAFTAEIVTRSGLHVPVDPVSEGVSGKTVHRLAKYINNTTGHYMDVAAVDMPAGMLMFLDVSTEMRTTLYES